MVSLKRGPHFCLCSQPKQKQLDYSYICLKGSVCSLSFLMQADWRLILVSGRHILFWRIFASERMHS